MKHGNKFYMEVSRSVWDAGLSDNATLLYFWLNELEQRFTGKNKNFFYRSDEQLTQDLGWGSKRLKQAKAELRQSGLIEVFQVRFKDKDGKQSTFWVTGYRVL